MLRRRRRAQDRRYEHEQPISWEGLDLYFYERSRMAPRAGAVPDQMGAFQPSDLVEDWVEAVDIVTPGDRNNRPYYELDEEKRRRWAVPYGIWLEFKKGVPINEGLLLEDWIENGAPVIPLGIVDDYYAQKIFTRKQLSLITDGNLAKVGVDGTRVRREKAIKAEAAETRTAQQRAEIASIVAAEVAKEVAQALAAAADAGPVKRPVGRPPKNGSAAELAD